MLVKPITLLLAPKSPTPCSGLFWCAGTASSRNSGDPPSLDNFHCFPQQHGGNWGSGIQVLVWSECHSQETPPP